MTARNGLSFSEITLRRVALVVIVNPRLKRLVTCVCRAEGPGVHRQSPLECYHHRALSSAYLSRSLGGSYMGTRSAQGTFVGNLPL